MDQILEGISKIINVVIIGSAVSLVGSIVLATIVFDKVSEDSTLPSQNIEMGVMLHITDQHIEAFMDAVLYIKTGVDIKRIDKMDAQGNVLEEGSIVDLFPVGDPAHGRGTVEFRMKVITEEEMPDMTKKMNKPLIPMAYVLESKFTEISKSFIKLGAVGIKMAGVFTALGALAGLGGIMLGVTVLFLDGIKTEVEPMDEDDDDQKY